MNIVYTILIFLCGAAFSLVPNYGKEGLFNKSFKGLRIIRPKGRLALGIVLVTVMLIIIQDCTNRDESNRKEQAALDKQHRRDSIDSLDRLRQEKRYKLTIESITRAQADQLAKYYLKYDSSTNRITRIFKDSSKVTTVQEASPQIDLYTTKALTLEKGQDNEHKFYYRLQSADAGSANIDISAYIVVEDSSANLIYVNKQKPFSNGNKLAKDRGIEPSYRFAMNRAYSSIPYIYVLLIGTYTNTNGDKKFKIDTMYGLNTVNGYYGITTEPTNSIVREFLKSKNVIK